MKVLVHPLHHEAEAPPGPGVGDVVELRSGGPSMVIGSVAAEKATCIWFDRRELWDPGRGTTVVECSGLHRQEFPLVALRKKDV